MYPYNRLNFNWRGRGGGTGFRSWRPSSIIESKPIPDDLGRLVDTISRSDLTPTKSAPRSISDAEVVASFNWLGSVGDPPVIAVPGFPPRWSPPVTTPKLSEDDGIYYRDLNAAYSPQSPMHATALAVLTQSDIDTSSIDLVACASTLRALFEFVRGATKTFRIMIQTIDQTIFFVRREGSPQETIPDVRGYGHSMPEAYTTWHQSVRNSISHQRIIKYNLAGLDMLVRYEADGYLPDELPKELRGKLSNFLSPSSVDPVNLEQAMKDARVFNRVATQETSNSERNGIKIKRAGEEIPQYAMFELKTRSAKRKEEDFFTEFAPRLWLTQTPWFLLAFHDRGVFNDIRITDVREKTASWEEENEENIKKFTGLLDRIVKWARMNKKGKLELWRHENGPLELRVPSDEYHVSLPSEIANRWVGDDTGSSGVSGSE